MNTINLLGKHLLQSICRTRIRQISISPALRLKEIQENQDGQLLTIEGKYVPSPREPYLLKSKHDNACPICASGLNIKHTDVLILSQFVRSDGCMLPKRITGLCNKQQRRVQSLVAMAQKAGLMPNLAPSFSKKDPKKRFGWKKFNKYFDETTIKT
ncbi:large ribosomal subunit protein mL66 [Cylas formicarius]|uniref:large ribosomal subunit protein mL66 n=1 Tax=Cylas formicarius TaxID=197179 RepID=UPI002958B656|nr:large ribosomal subunit protein mL66 [Cylas formicarius]